MPGQKRSPAETLQGISLSVWTLRHTNVWHFIYTFISSVVLLRGKPFYPVLGQSFYPLWLSPLVTNSPSIFSVFYFLVIISRYYSGIFLSKDTQWNGSFIGFFDSENPYFIRLFASSKNQKSCKSAKYEQKNLEELYFYKFFKVILIFEHYSRLFTWI